MSQYPKQAGTVYVEKLDDELCIYDWKWEKAHALNPTAALIWTLCDGQTSPACMAEQLQAKLNTTHAEELVWLTLVELEKAHLLEDELFGLTIQQTLTRREVFKGLGAVAVLLPIISSIFLPGPSETLSPLPTANLCVTATPSITPTNTPFGTPPGFGTPTVTPTSNPPCLPPK